MKKPKKPKSENIRTHRGLKSISRLAQDIGRTSFRKQGFNGVEIFKQWPYIVGDHLNQYCMPEKINWPRKQNELERDGMNGATLVIKCLGAFALEVESNASIILQRANIMFGYMALTKIKIKQVQVIDFDHKYVAEPALKVSTELKHTTETIKNECLRDALNALGAQVYKDQITKK